jgi:triosephosphate isomerase
MSRINLPIIIINLKTYEKGTGEAALQLAKIAEQVSHETGVCIALAPQFTDLTTLTKEVNLPVFAQHMDPILPGSHTGHILPEAVKATGAVGTLINHSEHRLPLPTIQRTVDRAEEVGLLSLVCADTPERTSQVAAFKPDMVAIEPPELIGTGIPVSKAKPEIVVNAVRLVRQQDSKVILLCGAGITKGEDVTAALTLGSQGVLLASGVVKAPNRRKAILDLVKGITEFTVSSKNTTSP